MTEQILEVKVEGETKELVIRKGNAPDIVVPKQAVIIGTLASIMAFVEHRKPNIETCHVEIDREKLFAHLFENPKDPLATEVKGSILLNPDLVKFNINTTCNMMDRTELKSFLRTNRVFFPNKEAHAQLVSAIESFSAKVQMEIQQSNDSRGNKAGNFTKEVKTDVPFDAVIEVSVFKGEPKKKIQIEICYDVTERGAAFWFESKEIDEVLINAVNEKFDTLVKELGEKQIMVIEK